MDQNTVREYPMNTCKLLFSYVSMCTHVEVIALCRVSCPSVALAGN